MQPLQQAAYKDAIVSAQDLLEFCRGLRFEFRQVAISPIISVTIPLMDLARRQEVA